MRFHLLPLFVTLAAAASAAPIDDAIALFNAKKFPDARVAFEKITAAEPANAVAASYLGQTLLRRGDPKAADDAVPWLEKATTLDPKNPAYFFTYGVAQLQLAEKNTSLSSASKGREALEKAITLNPDYLDAREALFRYYSRAPFFAGGSSAKAATQVEEIRKRDPDRGIILSVNSKVDDKDYAGAFKILDDTIAKTPDHYLALYTYGRTVAISGLNLPLGLARLQQCLKLTPPSPAAPSHSNAWNRIGNIQEKLKQPAEARTAYETALKLDPNNKPAADALAKLK
jgi:tetratricopeptide (TPR) repeat protein